MAEKQLSSETDCKNPGFARRKFLLRELHKIREERRKELDILEQRFQSLTRKLEEQRKEKLLTGFFVGLLGTVFAFIGLRLILRGLH